ncbi:MAG: M15 family metallopeptidase [Sulfurovaceae bacterium]|nr:M15 family metallopeptidase [Sulfurovaceae bacterium]
MADYRKIVLGIVLMFNILQAKDLPKGFVSVTDIIPNIELELRYYSNNNFMGRRVKGYNQNRAILTIEATKALAKVQKELNQFGLGLKIFDSYRPQKAVDDFVAWGRDLNDTLMKKKYYPTEDKKNLFRDGYIAKKSGHSRGSTIDLTIIDLDSKNELDMGSSFDFFGKVSWVKYSKIKANQRANRMLLHEVMMKYGFRPYTQEWWHFTLEKEPYPDKYFDFNI